MWLVLLCHSAGAAALSPAPRVTVLDAVTDANHGSPDNCSTPVFRWFDAHSSEFTSVLDLGGGQGEKGDALARTQPRLEYSCVDLETQGRCVAFDGKHLSAYANQSIDVVMSVFVLHHAGASTPSLLAEARRVARKYVVILDDLRADTPLGKEEQLHHRGCDAEVSGSSTGGCIFRSSDEYMHTLFPAAGLKLLEHGDDEEMRDCMLSNRGYPYPVPRGFYVLRP